jgi:hypothetical protein
MAARGGAAAAALVVVLLAMVAGTSWVSAAVYEDTWVVSYINAAPDCFSKTVLGINGAYPGPTITARQDDILKITFVNHVATEGITMHWHGIRQVSSCHSWLSLFKAGVLATVVVSDGAARVSLGQLSRVRYYWFVFEVEVYE